MLDITTRMSPVGYMVTIYNKYSYSELSILLLFILSRDTPAEVHFVAIVLQSTTNMLFYYVLFVIIT